MNKYIWSLRNLPFESAFVSWSLPDTTTIKNCCLWMQNIPVSSRIAYFCFLCSWDASCNRWTSVYQFSNVPCKNMVWVTAHLHVAQSEEKQSSLATVRMSGMWGLTASHLPLLSSVSGLQRRTADFRSISDHDRRLHRECQTEWGHSAQIKVNTPVLTRSRVHAVFWMTLRKKKKKKIRLRVVWSDECLHTSTEFLELS